MSKSKRFDESGKADRAKRAASGEVGVRRREDRFAPRPLRSLFELVRSSYRDDLDLDAAVEHALKAEASVRSGVTDLDADSEVLGVCLEALWDARRHDDVAALLAAWRELIASEKLRDRTLSPMQVLAWEVTALRQTARSLHRQQDTRAAWTAIMAAHRMLSAAAGSPEQLSALTAGRPFEGLGALYTQLLAIALPVGRNLSAAVRTARFEVFVDDAIAACGRIPLGDPGHQAKHALVVQTLFYVLRRKDRCHDEALVRDLFALDGSTRPRDARGQVSRFALYRDVADYFGEREAAAAYDRRNRAALLRANMRRHVDVIDSRYPRI